MKPKAGLNQNLKTIAKIVEWFEGQEELDIEEGLKKAKEAVEIIKETKKMLKKAENEFEEIKKELEKE
ncbi:MAG: exodeoxyribonuclease VII small subunit [Candidatus Pacebacteria bacterium]|nr:exodeoxyribonuclease VII small subunit [Candidatus Paceibacterota bacterium]